MSDPTTLRNAIESAIDSAPAEEAAPTPAPEPSPEAVEAAPAPEAKAADAAPSRTRDEQGRFSKLAEEEAPQAIQPGPKAEPKIKPAARAPASWRPDVREHWGQLPESVREEVARREFEVQRTLQETAAAQLGVSVKTLRRMVDRKEIPVYRFGRALRVDPTEIINATKQDKQCQSSNVATFGISTSRSTGRGLSSLLKLLIAKQRRSCTTN
jgi:excisionase family DNA binding protein